MTRPELPTRFVSCAACDTTHSNDALCDDCAQHCAIAIERHSEHDCGCRSCNVHRRALLALMDTDLRIYRLREVADARGLPSIAPAAPVAPEAPAAPDVDDIADSLPWERGYIPLTTLMESAHALAWRAYGAPRVRVSTLDGARWQVGAIDGDGAVQADVPTYIATSPEDAVAGWCTLVDELSTPALERGPAPVSLAEAFPAEDLGGIVVDVDGQVTDLATGEVLGSIASHVAPAAACAEVA